MEDKVKLMDKESAVETIKKLGEEDLRFLNRLIVERLNLLHQAKSTVQMARFSAGDRVSFQTNAGEFKTGVVLRLNKKTVSILTDDRRDWKVAPGLLRLEGKM